MGSGACETSVIYNISWWCNVKYVFLFSDLEVVALSITAEAFIIDNENYLFNRLNSDCPDAIPNLISRRQYNQRRKLTMMLGENIRQSIAKAIDGGETVFSIDSKPVKVCQNARAARCHVPC